MCINFSYRLKGKILSCLVINILGSIKKYTNLICFSVLKTILIFVGLLK